jgi:hypothetical protein
MADTSVSVAAGANLTGRASLPPLHAAAGNWGSCAGHEVRERQYPIHPPRSPEETLEEGSSRTTVTILSSFRPRPPSTAGVAPSTATTDRRSRTSVGRAGAVRECDAA